MENANDNRTWVTPDFLDARDRYAARYEYLLSLLERHQDSEYLCATNEDFNFYYMMDIAGFDIGEKAVWLAEQEDALLGLTWEKDGIKNRLHEDTMPELSEAIKAYEAMNNTK